MRPTMRRTVLVGYLSPETPKFWVRCDRCDETIGPFAKWADSRWC